MGSSHVADMSRHVTQILTHTHTHTTGEYDAVTHGTHLSVFPSRECRFRASDAFMYRNNDGESIQIVLKVIKECKMVNYAKRSKPCFRTSTE